MAGYRTALPYFAVLLLLLPCVIPEDVLGKKDGEFDFDGLPGAQHEFKFEVAGGEYECFYQNIRENATLHFSFEVLKGADKSVDFIIRQPDGKPLASHLWTNEGTTDKQIHMPGVHEFCIDNTNSRFASKLVYIYLVTYVALEWEAYARELSNLEISIGNFTSSIQNVDRDINKITNSLAYSKKHVMSDWYTIRYNNDLVRNWSIMMCIVVIATSCLQTYFVRNLFNTRNVVSGAKPRA